MNQVQPIRSLDKVRAIAATLRSQSDRNYVLFMTGLYTGLRISDLLQLRVRDVRARRQHLVVKAQKTGKRQYHPVNEHLRQILDDYTANWAPKLYLFRSRQGFNQPITRSMAYKLLRAAAEQHGVTDMGTHSLRKTFGYHLYRKEKSVALVQDMLGHSNPRETMRYIGIDQDEKDNAIKDFRF